MNSKSFFLTVLFVTAGFGQSPLTNVTALNNRGSQLQADHQLAEAGKLFAQAYAELIGYGYGTSPESGKIMNNLAVNARDQNNYTQADRYFQQALPLLTASFGEDSPEYANALANLGLLYTEEGRYQLASDTLKTAVRLQSRGCNVAPLEQARALDNLAFTLRGMGQSLEAADAAKRALDVLQAASPRPNEEKVKARLNLAAVQMNQKQFAAAEASINAAFQMANAILGPANSLLATIWNSRGSLAFEHGDHKAALRFYSQSAALWKENEGENSLGYAGSIANMASALSRDGKHQKAIALYLQALAIDKRILGPDHPAVAGDLSNLAAQFMLTNRPEQCHQLLTQVVTIQEHAFGSDHIFVARTLHNLGIVDARLGQYGEAANTYARAIDIVSRSEQKNALLPAWLEEYSHVLRADARFAEAEETEVRATRVQVRNALAAYGNN